MRGPRAVAASGVSVRRGRHQFWVLVTTLRGDTGLHLHPTTSYTVGSKGLSPSLSPESEARAQRRGVCLRASALTPKHGLASPARPGPAHHANSVGRGGARNQSHAPKAPNPMHSTPEDGAFACRSQRERGPRASSLRWAFAFFEAQLQVYAPVGSVPPFPPWLAGPFAVAGVSTSSEAGPAL